MAKPTCLSEERPAKTTAPDSLPVPVAQAMALADRVAALLSTLPDSPIAPTSAGLSGRTSRTCSCARLAPDFLRFVETLVSLGFGCAWRVLDGRGFGIADQPRRRLYLVGHRGNAAASGAVLFERPGDRGHQPQIPDAAPVLTARGGMAFDDRTPCILEEAGPRIATPREWERAMGFPDDFTLVPFKGRMMADGPRYRMLGNSMSVRAMRWIGGRIQAVEDLRLNGSPPLDAIA